MLHIRVVWHQRTGSYTEVLCIYAESVPSLFSRYLSMHAVLSTSLDIIQAAVLAKRELLQPRMLLPAPHPPLSHKRARSIQILIVD